MKTAGTSVEGLLEKHCLPVEEVIENQNANNGKYTPVHERSSYISEGGVIGPRHLPAGKAGWSEHMRASLIKKKMGDARFNRFFKFTIIRNPWEKVLSYYFHKKNGMSKNKGNEWMSKESFAKFVSTQTHSLDHYLYNINGEKVCDFYIRYENLKEDLQTVADKLGIKDLNIEDLPEWKSNYKTDDEKELHYSQFYTPQLRDHIARIYKREIEEFGYTFDSHVQQKIDNIEEKIREDNL